MFFYFFRSIVKCMPDDCVSMIINRGYFLNHRCYKYIYIYINIYIYAHIYTNRFFEVAIESWLEWD